MVWSEEEHSARMNVDWLICEEKRWEPEGEGISASQRASRKPRKPREGGEHSKIVMWVSKGEGVITSH